MGIDIIGYFETRSKAGGPWQAAGRLAEFLDARDADGFECLFGVKGWAGFEPLAERRGLPDDVSEPVRAHFDRFWQPFAASWIGWAEIKAMDGEETAADAAFTVYAAEEMPGGEVTWRRVGWRPEFNYDVFEEFGLEPYDLCVCARPGSVHEPWPPGAEWLVSPGVRHRVEPLRRVDVVGPDTVWGPAWQAMAELAAQHGDANVRLVVWFFA